MGEYKANIVLSPKGGELFPMLGARSRGLAQLAAGAEHVEDGHDVEFRMMEARSILNRSVSKRRLSMAYSINPYRGCEFGCRYCYARYTHEFLAPSPGLEAGGSTGGACAAEGSTAGNLSSPEVGSSETDPGQIDLREVDLTETSLRDVDLRVPDAFERVIFLKKNAAWLLEQELRRIDPADEIALGTSTDPYQPIERRAMVTRSLLEVFARKEGYRLGIVTKSQLIERDIDLLSVIARRNTLVVHVTVTTADAALARKLEPRAPRPDLRLGAIRSLRAAGIRAGILCSPLLPGITDTEGAIDGMARLAAEAGASFFAAEPLFLKPCSRPTYLSFVREHFPALEAEYAERFGTAEFAAKPYRERMARLVEGACRRYGIPERSTDALLTRDAGAGRKEPAGTPYGGQQRLFA